MTNQPLASLMLTPNLALSQVSHSHSAASRAAPDQLWRCQHVKPGVNFGCASCMLGESLANPTRTTL